MKVRNQANTVLGVPRVGPIAPGQSRDIPDAVTHNKVVAAWISKGMLVVEGGNPAPEPGHEPDQEGMTKDDMIAELGAYGVVRDKRTSKGNLEALLEEVRAERAEDSDETEAE